MKTMTLEEFKELKNKQNRKPEDITYRCPSCKTLQSANDLIKAGAGSDIESVEGFIAFSCIGRWDKSKGCDWTLGGLFKFHELEVIHDGKKYPFFMPDDGEDKK